MRKKLIAVISGMAVAATLLGVGGTTYAYWEKTDNTQVTQAAAGWSIAGWQQTGQVSEARMFKPTANFAAPTELIEAINTKTTKNVMIPLDVLFKGAFQARFTVNGSDRYYRTDTGSFHISFWMPASDDKCASTAQAVNFLTVNDNPYGEQLYPTYICAKVSGFYNKPSITQIDWVKAGLSLSGGFYQEFWNKDGAAPKR